MSLPGTAEQFAHTSVCVCLVNINVDLKICATLGRLTYASACSNMGQIASALAAPVFCLMLCPTNCLRDKGVSLAPGSRHVGL